MDSSLEEEERNLFDLSRKKKAKAVSVVEQHEKATEEDVDFGDRKKKKKRNILAEKPAPITDDERRDYKYEELLTRFYGMLRQHHPQSTAKKGFLIPVAVLGREGTKKTVWTNFTDTCRQLKRDCNQLMDFTLIELGTDKGSLDQDGALIIQGRFNPRNIENVLRRYAAEYIACRTCKGHDTVIMKGENRLQFIVCRSCQSRFTVPPIKRGFVAQVGKRKK